MLDLSMCNGRWYFQYGNVDDVVDTAYFINARTLPGKDERKGSTNANFN